MQAEICIRILTAQKTKTRQITQNILHAKYGVYGPST